MTSLSKMLGSILLKILWLVWLILLVFGGFIVAILALYIIHWAVVTITVGVMLIFL